MPLSTQPTARLGHHPPAPSAGSGSGRGVSAPNGRGRPEPAHRAPGADVAPFAQQLQHLLPHTTKQNHEQPTGARLRLTVSGPAPHTTVASVLSSRVEPITLAMHSRSTPCPCSLHCHTHSSLNSSVLSQHGMNGRVAHHSTTTVSDSASFCHTRTAYLGHLTCTAVTPARRNLGASFVHILCPHRRCLP